MNSTIIDSRRQSSNRSTVDDEVELRIDLPVAGARQGRAARRLESNQRRKSMKGSHRPEVWQESLTETSDVDSDKDKALSS